MEAEMTTDCVTEFIYEDCKDFTTQDRKDAIPAHELGAAIIVALGFVLLLPGAAVLMSLLNG
jgi:hypothetical protein